MKSKKNALPRSTGLKELLSNSEAYADQYQAVVLLAESLNSGELSRRYRNEYNSWRNRKKYSKDHNIPWFQGMDDFSNFLLVNGPIPHAQWTLDRINPKGGYVPENLRWASKATQSQNRTNARFVDLNGSRMTTRELAQKTGRSYDAVRMGLNRRGISYALALQPAPQIHALTAIREEVTLWQFPGNCQMELEMLYAKREQKKFSKPRFFVELLAYEVKLRHVLLKSNESIEVKADAEADIAVLTPLLNETQAYIDGINERIYYIRYELQPNKCLLNVKPQDPQPPPEWDPDYYLKLKTGNLPWVTYPQEVDPVFRLFPKL